MMTLRGEFLRGRLWASLVTALLIASGCVGGEGDREFSGRLGLALIAPAADATEVRSLGLYALSVVSPELECSEYLDGTVDPISQRPEALVAVDYVDIPTGSNEVPFSFRGIPAGDRSIIVEAYDSGDSRIFMGCAQTLVEEDRTVSLEITMVEDELTGQ